MAKMIGSQLLVKCLEAQGVEYIFGIPGAKIDAVFDALLDSTIQLIVCRHEQNAAFMAGAYGRLTGKPGVVLVTSGPGVGNLTTGLLTATTEGDPVIAIGGNVPLQMALKQSHQGTQNAKLMEAVTKSSVEAHHVDNIPEVVENAFRLSVAPQSGACFISLPQDILNQESKCPPIKALPRACFGNAPKHMIEDVAHLINQAKQPVILLGLEASRPENTKAIRKLLKSSPIPVVGTYQAAGVISKQLLDCFVGRVGLFKNQPGDQMLDLADVVLTIGFNSVEYDPEVWNVENNKTIIHLNYTLSDIHNTYHPVYEMLGDIGSNVEALSKKIKGRDALHGNKKIEKSREKLLQTIESGKDKNTAPIHPLRFIHELNQVVDDKTTICCDIGTVYMLSLIHI